MAGRAVVKDEDIPNLLGGFAAGVLTARERELLFTAALKDQRLFDALADEEALRELLADPVARGALLRSIEPAPNPPGAWSRFNVWMRQSAALALAGGAIAALVVFLALRQERRFTANRPAKSAAVENAPKPEPSPMARLAPPTPAAPPASKLKVAVLEFKTPAAKDSDMGKTASDLLGRKLHANGYAVIDRKQVAQALKERKLENRLLDSAAAASVGRSLGADTVIIGSVQPAVPAPESSKAAPGAIGGFRPAEEMKAHQPERDLQVTATAINPQTESNLAVASAQSRRQSPGAGLAGAVDQVAQSLGQQIQQKKALEKTALQKTASGVSATVTGVTGSFLTLDAGSNAGLKVGDWLELRRDAKPIGQLVITSVKESVSVGEFHGGEAPRIGDVAVSGQNRPPDASAPR